MIIHTLSSASAWSSRIIRPCLRRCLITERQLRPGDLRASALDLEQLDDDLFRADAENLWVPAGGVGVFGGQVWVQLPGESLVKPCTRPPTLPDTTRGVMGAHSLHSYFLRPGDSTRSIIYTVKRLRDGRTFSSRSVEAVQGGKVIFKCSISYQLPEESILGHQSAMPTCPRPEELAPIDYEAIAKKLMNRPDTTDQMKQAILKALDRPFPIDIRYVEKPLQGDPDPQPRAPHQLVWMKTSRPLPEESSPNLHSAVAAYYSDYSLLLTILLPYGIPFPSKQVKQIASLDHSMWFHSPFRADEWMLYQLDSPRAGAGRGLAFGKLFTLDGVHAVTVAQEGLLRVSNAPTL